MVPAGCMSGTMDHLCADCIDVTCGHEIECSSDPCNILLVTVSKSRLDDDQTVENDFPIDLPEYSIATSCFQTDSSLLVTTSQIINPLPMPVSALPLLC